MKVYGIIKTSLFNLLYMRIILKILNYFFVTLGVLFFAVIILVVYLFVADPFGLKPLFKNFGISPSSAVNIITGKTSALAPTPSEKTLKSLGVDTAGLLTQITPQMEDCFNQKLGAQRVDEIKKGGAITPLDFVKASVCLK